MEYREYKAEFWKRALDLVDGAKQCEVCHVFHNEKTRPRTLVRLVLTGDGKPMASRLRMLCTSCFRDPVPIRFTKKQILDRIAELPFPGQESEARRNA